MVKSSLMDMGVMISPSQLRKLKTGGAITLKPSQMNIDGAVHQLKLMPQTFRRMNTGIRKQKGVRVALKPEEDIVAMTEGGAISLKSIGKTLGKVGKTIKKGFDKEIVDSGVGKEIAKSLIRGSTQVLLPAATSGLSMMMGDPTGTSGAFVGNIAGDKLQKLAEKRGYGVFKALSKVGISKRSLINSAKAVGKEAVAVGAKAVGEAITAYTGNPIAGSAFESVATSGGNKLIDSGSVKKSVKTAGKSAKKIVKDIAVEAVDDIVDKQFSGAEKKVAEKALAGAYPSAKDLVYDYADIKSTNIFSGYGMPRRTRGGLRYGASPKPTIIQSSYSMNSGFKVADDRAITAAEPPSSIIQTGSPYQRINSPAMSPFIPASPQLVHLGKMGGSFLPAGTR